MKTRYPFSFRGDPVKLIEPGMIDDESLNEGRFTPDRVVAFHGSAVPHPPDEPRHFNQSRPRIIRQDRMQAFVLIHAVNK